jgi:hypothetical protein
VNALHQIHQALEPAGLVIDTQPISARPPVESRSGPLGTLDMREWARMIAAVDGQVEEALHGGLFQLLDVRHFVVTDEFEDGSELVEKTRDWAGTRFDEHFAQRVGRDRSPVRLHQTIRLRVLQARRRGGVVGCAPRRL